MVRPDSCGKAGELGQHVRKALDDRTPIRVRTAALRFYPAWALSDVGGRYLGKGFPRSRVGDGKPLLQVDPLSVEIELVLIHDPPCATWAPSPNL